MTEVSYDFPQNLPDATLLLVSAQRMVAIQEAEREDAVQTVFKLIHGVLGDLENAKKRRVKKANETFHRKVGRHACAVDFLRAAGFRDADDPEAEGEAGKGALLSMPVAYVARITDGHHTLARLASEAGLQVPALPGGSGFNPYASSVQKMDTTRSAKAPESWKSEAEQLREQVKKRERELQEKVTLAPPVDLRPAAFWLAAGTRLEEVIREAAQQEEERAALGDGGLLKDQVMSAKQAISGTSTFESADKKRLAELGRRRAYQACILRIICPDKSVLQVHFRASENGEQVLELIEPLLAPHVKEARWYLYQSPPLKRLQAKETMAAAGLTPGANVYLGFDGDKPAPPYLSPDLVEQLGPCRPEESGVTAPAAASFTGEAMGWGAGQRLGGPSGASSTGPAWLKQPKTGASSAANSGSGAAGAEGGSSEAAG